MKGKRSQGQTGRGGDVQVLFTGHDQPPNFIIFSSVHRRMFLNQRPEGRGSEVTYDEGFYTGAREPAENLV